jgi:hypothetical protein
MLEGVANMQPLRGSDDLNFPATMAPDRRGCGMGGRELRVAVRARASGGYTYQIFTVASEPRTLVSAENDNSYASPADAERAGYEAVAVLKSKRLR